jgi:hypothetical protein
MVKTQKKNSINISKKTKKIDKGKISSTKNNAKKIWNGYGIDIIFGLVYLLEKYDNICFPLSNPDNTMRSMTLSMVCGKNVKNATKKNDYKFRFPISSDNLVSMIQSCSLTARFIALPIYIVYDDCKMLGHMNILLFDKEKNTIDRFDSYGRDGYTKKESLPFSWFDQYFIKWLKDNKIQYKYNSTKNSPSIGPQELEELQIENNLTDNLIERDEDPNGFCSVWSILLLDYRLKYPKLTYKEVLSKIMKEIKNNNITIRTWIRKYCLFIARHRDNFLKNYKLKNNMYTNLWIPKLEREIHTIFNKRINGKLY